MTSVIGGLLQAQRVAGATVAHTPKARNNIRGIAEDKTVIRACARHADGNRLGIKAGVACRCAVEAMMTSDLERAPEVCTCIEQLSREAENLAVDDRVAMPRERGRCEVLGIETGDAREHPPPLTAEAVSRCADRLTTLTPAESDAVAQQSAPMTMPRTTKDPLDPVDIELGRTP